MISGQTSDVNVHNADGTTGRVVAQRTASVALCTEDQATIAGMAAQLDMKLSDLAAALESITVVVSSLVGLKDTTNTAIDPAVKSEQVAANLKLEDVKTKLDTAIADLVLLVGKDYSTETTLASVLTESQAIVTALGTLNSKDFATQTTLAAVLVQVQAVVSALATLNAKDFATETTLAAINAKIPSAPATAGNQATEISSLASIDGKLPSTLGQKAMAYSLSIVIASDQSNVPVSGTITANIGTTNGLALDATLSTMSAKLPSSLAVSGGLKTSIIDPIPPGTNVIGHVIIDSGSVAITGSVTANIGSTNGLALDATLSGMSAKLPSGLTGSGNLKVAVEEPLPSGTNVIGGVTQSGTWTITANIGTAGSLALDATVSAMSSKLPSTIGQHAMASSMSMVIASDQSAIPVSQSGSWTVASSQSGTWNVGLNAGTNVIGLVKLADNTGAFLDPRTIRALTSADTVTAVQSGTWAISAAALPLPSGAATSAKQPALGVAGTPSTDVITIQGIATGTAVPTSFTSGSTATVVQPTGTNLHVVIDSGAVTANITQIGSAALSLGQKTMAASIPVVLASDQTTILTKTQDGSGNNITSTAVDGKQSLDVSINSGNVASYMASTNGIITSGTAGGNITSAAYLWHPAANAKRIEITRIVVTVHAMSGNAGDVNLRLARITAENGTPGGNSQTINALDQADPASGCTFRTGATGAPTRAGGDYAVEGASADMGGFSNCANFLRMVIFDEKDFGKPLICRASVAEGYEIRNVVNTALTTGVRIAVTYYWREV